MPTAREVLDRIDSLERFMVESPALAREALQDSLDREASTEVERQGGHGRHAHRAERMRAKVAEAEAADSLAVRQEWNAEGTFMVTVRTLPPAKRQSVGDAALRTRSGAQAAKRSPLKGVTGGRVLDSVTTSTEVHTLGRLKADYDRILSAAQTTYPEELSDLILEARDLGKALARREGCEREAAMMQRTVELLRQRQRNAPRK